jgi:hypothetical protein
MKEIHEAAILEELHGACADHVGVFRNVFGVLSDLEAGGKELDLHPLEHARNRGLILRIEGREALHETSDVHRREYHRGVPDAQSRAMLAARWSAFAVPSRGVRVRVDASV